MIIRHFARLAHCSCPIVLVALLLPGADLTAADRVNMIYTARVMSQAYPWIAQEAGLYKK